MLVFVVVALGWGLGLAPVQAQVWSQSTGSRSGLFGQRAVGSTIAAGSRTMTGSAMGGPMGTNASLSNVGQVSSSDRFVRGSRQAGQFVGTGGEDVRQFVGAAQAGNVMTGVGQTTGLGGMGRSAVTGLTQRQTARQVQPGARTVGRGAAASGARQLLHVPLKVDFDYPKPDPALVATKLTAELDTIKALRRLGPIEVVLNDRTAILRGTVASSRDRELAERLVRLEPGIWEVKNDLVVQSSGASRPGSPSD